MWPKQRSEAWAFLANPMYLNSAPAGARVTNCKSLKSKDVSNPWGIALSGVPTSTHLEQGMAVRSACLHGPVCVPFQPKGATALGADAHTDSHPSL